MNICVTRKHFSRMARKIPFLDLTRQIAAERREIDEAFDRVLRRGQLLQGPELAELERELAEWNGVAHAVGVASGCDAIALLLKAAGIGAGDEVVVPAFTCPATWMGICQTGARPVPAEVGSRTGLLDPQSAAKACTPATRAILAVHLYGAPCVIGALRAVCDDKNLPLFIDAAQSIGAIWEGSRAAALADGAAFSFYPTKNLGALDDAGAVLTPHPALAETVRSLRNYGKDAGGAHVRQGANARMGELQAAVLRLRLKKVEAGNHRRRHLAEIYLQELEGTAGLGLPPADPASVWHLFAVRILPARDRDEIALVLREQGIGTAVHYREAFHHCPAFQSAERVPAAYPHADAWARTVLSLPLHPLLTNDEVRHISSRLTEALRRSES